MSTAAIPKARYLPPKEAGSFRQILQLYETRQYKKALKVADTILKKFPDHGETLAMKGLILCFSEKKEEGHELIKKGLRNDLTSFICWHVYGLFYRSERNFEEAAKCYVHALKYAPDNTNILRDLALLQCQMRNWEGLITSRKSILSQRPNVRQHWTGLALGYHMVKNYELAENILSKYEETLKEPPKEDYEHSELVLYKSMIIYESGNVKRALEHLESVADQVTDKLSLMEYRAKYLLDLERLPEAVKAYTKLLRRNPDNKEYFFGLEKALGIKDDVEKKKALYQVLAKQYKYSDLAKSIPLSFLSGEDFREAVRSYIVGLLSRGVPSAFVNLKPLYADEAKVKVIEEVALEFLRTLTGTRATDGTNGIDNGPDMDGDSTPTTYLWTIYYLAQHYSKVGEADLALEYITKAIEHTPTLVEAHMVKAKILKRKGDLVAASESMTTARELDLQDRFVNTKAAKYLMRAGKTDEAINVVSLFTKNDAHGKGVADLHEMQAIWFLTEQGEMFNRLGKIGLALKRFEAVKKIFDDRWGDQFDYHQYCVRRGTMRAYVDLVQWEETLYSEHEYTRAAFDAIQTYISLYDTPKSARVAAEFEGLTEEERKKAIKKAKRERAKLNKKSETEKSANDDDPLGKNLENTTTPLEMAEQFWKPIADSPVKVPSWTWGEEIAKRKEHSAARVESETTDTTA
ncbi:NMDA receptor-regulated protein 1-domain-containing protein [Lipomyces tetrasporus]|uniref:NMDA receptor-regulated protein 1-domain-containing protein n=1 Tax=Lipomyces tetrasporus TaxID=54092 RepID=A0AAD7VRG9_9ASCO|nr:NMDA receptor-regulated protein 1-domain-containing protein [Lipomyces tetrasporus]KAJ8099188.1 NMDA receptor-regulated protein 1-domain-containing protein [Lipomyces tetrasporus]